MADVINYIFSLMGSVWSAISDSWLLSLAIGLFFVKKWVVPALRNILYSN